MNNNPANITDRVNSILSRYRGDVIAGMRAALDRPGVDHLRYMRYHLGWEDEHGAPTDAGAGKMLRPALCLLACEAVGGDAHQAMPAAVAIELLHNFTLIHDDIEDSSELRHGRDAVEDRRHTAGDQCRGWTVRHRPAHAPRSARRRRLR